MKKITSFTRATKIFRNIFNQKLKGLCNENDKTLIKEIMNTPKKGKIPHVHELLKLVLCT